MTTPILIAVAVVIIVLFVLTVRSGNSEDSKAKKDEPPPAPKPMPKAADSKPSTPRQTPKQPAVASTRTPVAPPARTSVGSPAARAAPTTPTAPRAVAIPVSDLAEDESDMTVVWTAARSQALKVMGIVPRFTDPGAMQPPPVGATGVRAVAAFRASKGKVRERHEDSFAVLGSGVYAIADGVGGHAGGGVASRTATEAFQNAFKDNKFEEGNFMLPVPDTAKELVGAILAAHTAVRNRAKDDKALADMATTFLAVRIHGPTERLHIAHVGDSRCYRFREGTLSQLTMDHVTQQETKSGKAKNYLARAVGVGDELSVDLALGVAQPGDKYLLCTDGLYLELTQDEIKDTLTNVTDIHDCAAKLVSIAESKGGRDNISLMLLNVQRDSVV